MKHDNNKDFHVLSSTELRQLQMALLDMLCEVDRICKKYDIPYSLIGGTLLGAVRHGGFIPWDDDLDITMLRDHYDRFREVCKHELNVNLYFFQDHTTDPHYRWGYGRIRRKNSEFVRVGQEHMRMQTGIFLDIFPGDNVPDFYPVRILHAFFCFIYRKVLYAEAGMKTGKNVIQRNFYMILFHIPTSFVFRRLENMSKRWNQKPTKLVRPLTFPTPKGSGFGFPRIWYEELMELEFEERMFMAPRAYKDYLTFKFGDYMKLPPRDKRHWHPASTFRLPPDTPPMP
jgi:lipopolysaccharide cholinephosphotransferase